MPVVPNAPPFVEFLQGVPVLPPPESHRYSSVSWQDCLPDGVWNVAQPPLSEIGSQRLWIPKNSTLGWNGFSSKVQQNLRDAGHPANDLVVWSLVALFAWLRRGDSPLDDFNRFIEESHLRAYRQIYYFPWLATSSSSVSLHGVYFGPSSSSLSHHRPDASSREFDELLNKGHWCVASPSGSVRLIDLEPTYRILKDRLVLELRSETQQELGETLKALSGDASDNVVGISDLKLWNGLGRLYHLAIVRLLDNWFWTKVLPIHSSMLSAYHGTTVDYTVLWTVPQTMLLTIIADAAGKIQLLSSEQLSSGVNAEYFEQLVAGLALAQPRLEQFPVGAVPRFNHEADPLSALAWRFAGIVDWSKRHVTEHSAEEAIFLATMGLETVFGGDRSVVDSLSRRVALCHHRLRGVAYDDARQQFKKLYDTRSRFAHAAARGTGATGATGANGVRLALELCDVAFEVLSQVRVIQGVSADNGAAAEANSRPWSSVDEWRKYLDFLATAIEARVLLDEQAFRVAGLVRRQSA